MLPYKNAAAIQLPRKGQDSVQIMEKLIDCQISAWHKQ